ncbi:hypothetical protein [Allofustis seminis]|uniref:hypothetical protein n=1 Tax=Allofustis seminis TaxID=166939 RepID=UPI000378A0F1|nr:hypothetical protein [Allofustis seminis]
METVYTTYWISKRDGIKKRHATYKTEEQAIEGIKAWWELQGDRYEPTYERTNTGALEIAYIDDNYFYRVESSKTDQPLPPTSYQLFTQGQIEAKRGQWHVDDDLYLFDELPEAYRDRLIMAMNDILTARAYIYTEKGRPVQKMERK